MLQFTLSVSALNLAARKECASLAILVLHLRVIFAQLPKQQKSANRRKSASICCIGAVPHRAGVAVPRSVTDRETLLCFVLL